MKRIRQMIDCGVIAALSLCGCDVYKPILCRSYVPCYSNLRTIELQTIPEREASRIPSDLKCMLICPGNDIPKVEFSLFSTGKEKEEYDRLCVKHNDLSYNQYRHFLHHFASGSMEYIDKDFVSIEISSDKDYNPDHLAGTNLSDIVRFMSWSAYRFIQSGYSRYYHYAPSDVSESFRAAMSVYFGEKWFRSETDATCYPIDKMVNELQQEDLILLGHDWTWPIGILCFETLPAESGEHTITVRMTTDDGEILEDSILISFGK